MDGLSIGHSVQNDNSQKRVMVQHLLSEIYHRYQLQKQFDSSTETSCLSDGMHGHNTDTELHLKREQNKKLQSTFLNSRDMDELQSIKEEVEERISVMSTKLVRQLKQRNRLRDKHKRYCDTITAVLQAVSRKRKVDAKLKFNMEPVEGEDGFKQWCDALRAIVRLPGGIPSCWRKRIWISLADHYVETREMKTSNTLSRVFSDRICQADESLGNQIVKDLHRTGYSNLSSSEESNIEDRLVLKRVLLAYARWNQAVGYCQGFNVLAALILQVTEGKEEAAFKIMVHLIDGVLPENYFANNLQALSVDMAVFRDLLRARLPQLSKHLDVLQKEANENSKGSNYEPPLTNVFTMQWFLTLFATCLPPDTVLRIWDSVMLDGNEILLRVALAIWAKLGEKIGELHSADEFYCNMSELMQQALNGKLINGDELVRMSYRVASFPFPHLKQLREKYTYNITPFAAENSEELKNAEYSQENCVVGPRKEQQIAEYEDPPFFCFTGLVSTVPTPATSHDRKKQNKQSLEDASSRDRFGETFQVQRGNSMMSERMSTDIAALKNQYMMIRSRQLRAHLVYTKPEMLDSMENLLYEPGMFCFLCEFVQCLLRMIKCINSLAPVIAQLKLMAMVFTVPAYSSKKTDKGETSPKINVPVMVNHLLIGRKEAKVQNLSMTPLKIKDGRSNTRKAKSSHKT